MKERIWQFPTIPLTPIDLINRRAAATGSPGYAMAASYADYNGHHVTVSFKPHAVCGPIWNAEYFWAGRVVIGRGSFEHCVRAAKQEHERGAHGTTVRIYLDTEAPESLDEQVAIVQAAGAVEVTDTNAKPDWWTPVHEAVTDALFYDGERHHFPGLVHHALQYKGTSEDWPKERDRWLESTRPQRRTGS